MQSKRRYSGNDAMIHGQQESKNNRSGLRSAMTATRKRKFEQSSTNNGSIHQEQNIIEKTAENRATKVCTITELQEATVRIKPENTGATAP
jgi:hypothetical protein